METIKKYQNRKLYSTKSSSYVDLEYIVDLVKMGKFGKFQVICNKDKSDITKETLMSAIALTNPSTEDILAFIWNH